MEFQDDRRCTFRFSDVFDFMKSPHNGVQHQFITHCDEDICVTHTAGCGVPDTTPAPENNVAICQGGKKKEKKEKENFFYLLDTGFNQMVSS